VSITDKAREILAQQGVDIDQLGDAPPPDVAAIMVENATAALAEFVAGDFVNARIRHADVARWVRDFLTETLPHPMLLIIGPLGTGKSSHCYAALRECVLGRARQRRTMTWQMTSHSKFNAAMRPAPDDAHLAAYTRAEQADLLILDDLGAGISTDWTADTLYRLIDERWARRRPTIVSSNYTPDQMVTRVDPRVVSRIASGLALSLKGSDQRFNRAPA
jgi:DNA replication protein DnaC